MRVQALKMAILQATVVAAVLTASVAAGLRL